jgi:hypothetical protein
VATPLVTPSGDGAWLVERTCDPASPRAERVTLRVQRRDLPPSLPRADAAGDRLGYAVTDRSLPRGLRVTVDGRFRGSTEHISGRHTVHVTASKGGAICVELDVVIRVVGAEMPPTDATVAGAPPTSRDPLTAAILMAVASAALLGARRWLTAARPAGERG